MIKRSRTCFQQEKVIAAETNPRESSREGMQQNQNQNNTNDSSVSNATRIPAAVDQPATSSAVPTAEIVTDIQADARTPTDFTAPAAETAMNIQALQMLSPFQPYQIPQSTQQVIFFASCELQCNWPSVAY